MTLRLLYLSFLKMFFFQIWDQKAACAVYGVFLLDLLSATGDYTQVCGVRLLFHLSPPCGYPFQSQGHFALGYMPTVGPQQ